MLNLYKISNNWTYLDEKLCNYFTGECKWEIKDKDHVLKDKEFIIVAKYINSDYYIAVSEVNFYLIRLEWCYSEVKDTPKTISFDDEDSLIHYLDSNNDYS